MEKEYQVIGRSISESAKADMENTMQSLTLQYRNDDAN